MHRLSIITINYNNVEGLRNTLASVANQTDKNFEYIVVDGGSTDGSVDVIREYQNIIDIWVSEPDKGIYNAMNKGSRLASGSYVTFVNSGDCLADSNVMADVLAQIGTINKDDLIFGKVLDVFDGGTNIYSFSHDLTLMSLHYGVVNHSGCFIKRELQLAHPYREDLKICSDRQFFIEAIIFDNCSYSHIDRIITHFDKTGISSSQVSDKLIDEENEKILASVVPPRIIADYKKTNLLLSELTSKMTNYYGFSKMMCHINSAALKLYSFFRK